MWCLAPGILVFVNALIIGHYFSGSGKYHVNTLGSTVGLIITIILSYLLIPRFGYMGAAVTASISYLATSVFVTWFFCREAHLKFSSLLPLPKYFSSYWITLKDYLYHKNQNSRNE
jgi:O-antigen/teichoic acid export membrane protein